MVVLSVPTFGRSGEIVKSVDVHTNDRKHEIINFEIRADVKAVAIQEGKGTVCR